MHTNDITTCIVGNLTADPELRFTASGIAVAKLSIAVTARIRKGTEWVDGETTFIPATVWRDLAENCANSLAKGTRVIAYGSLRTETWTTDDVKKSRIVMDVAAIGPDLTWATATVRRAVRSDTATDTVDGDEWSTARPATSGARGR